MAVIRQSSVRGWGERGHRTNTFDGMSSGSTDRLLTERRAQTLLNKIKDLFANDRAFYVATCCCLFAFVSHHLWAFPKSVGNSTRHACDISRRETALDDSGKAVHSFRCVTSRGCGSHLSIVLNEHFEEDGAVFFARAYRHGSASSLPRRELTTLPSKQFRPRKGPLQ